MTQEEELKKGKEGNKKSQDTSTKEQERETDVASMVENDNIE